MDRDEAIRLLRGGANGIAEWNRRRKSSNELVDLRNANLVDANLSTVDFSGADLRSANFGSAQLGFADLTGANLSEASLLAADLGWAKLVEANLLFADLRAVNLTWADLRGADLRFARCFATTFAAVDLSNVEGLALIDHQGPSTIGIDTLFRSNGKIPEVFLRECGVPDAVINSLPGLIGATQPFQFHSCFLSYSTQDETFASKLHADLRTSGIRCWKWNHDARTGQPIWGEIDRAIAVHDKLILVPKQA